MKCYCPACECLTKVSYDFRGAALCSQCQSPEVRMTLRQRMALVAYFKRMRCPTVEIAPGLMRRGDVWYLEQPSMGGAVLHRPHGRGMEYWDWNELDVWEVAGSVDEEENLDRLDEPHLPESKSWYMKKNGDIVEIEKLADGVVRTRRVPDGSFSTLALTNAIADWSCMVDQLVAE